MERNPAPPAESAVRREGQPTGPNRTWVTDLTYVRTAEGWLYVAMLLDLWGRRVAGWATAPSPRCPSNRVKPKFIQAPSPIAR